MPAALLSPGLLCGRRGPAERDRLRPACRRGALHTVLPGLRPCLSLGGAARHPTLARGGSLPSADGVGRLACSSAAANHPRANADFRKCPYAIPPALSPPVLARALRLYRPASIQRLGHVGAARSQAARPLL